MFGTKSMLIIDENAKDILHYTDRLKLYSPNCKIFHAATGQAGLDLCGSNSIDCVILEIELPDMSGFEVLVKLVPMVKHPKIPIIVLTRLSNPDLLDLARRHGAQAALHKLATTDDILT